MEYLEFEKEIEELELQITNTKEIGHKTNSDVTKIVTELEKKILKKKKEIYHNLSPWERVQLSRHPNRPYTLDYINHISNKTFINAYKKKR